MNDLLLVEDDEDVRQDLAFLIEREGFRVGTAANGQEALAWLRAQGAPRLVIIDLMMPIMDGWALRKELLEDPKLRELPIVIVSGASDVRAEAKALGAAGWLGKPIDLDKLFQLLQIYCAEPRH